MPPLSVLSSQVTLVFRWSATEEAWREEAKCQWWKSHSEGDLLWPKSFLTFFTLVVIERKKIFFFTQCLKVQQVSSLQHVEFLAPWGFLPASGVEVTAGLALGVGLALVLGWHAVTRWLASVPVANPCSSLSHLIFLSVRFALTGSLKLLGNTVTEAVICVWFAWVVTSVVGVISSCNKYQGAIISQVTLCSHGHLCCVEICYILPLAICFGGRSLWQESGNSNECQVI